MKRKSKGFTAKQPVPIEDNQQKAGSLVPESQPLEAERVSEYDPEDELARIEKEMLSAELPRSRDLIDRIFGLYPQDNSIERLERAAKKTELLIEIRRNASELILQKRRLGLNISYLEIQRFKDAIILHPKVQQLTFELHMERIRSERLTVQQEDAERKLEILQLEKKIEYERLRWERRLEILKEADPEELQKMLQQEYAILEWEKKIQELKSPRKDEDEKEKEQGEQGDIFAVEPEIKEAISFAVEDVYELAKEKEKRK